LAIVRSEKKTDFLGNEYIQHYDERGLPAGRSEERERLFGGKYIQHYDNKGQPIGTSEEYERLFGGKYTQHYDKKGLPSGTSEKHERLFGGKYTQHYDNKGLPSGRSEEYEGILGGKYTQHSGISQHSSRSSVSSASSASAGYSSTGTSHSSANHSSGTYTYSGTSSSGYTSSTSAGFNVSITSGITENILVLLCVSVIMLFITPYLIQLYQTKPMIYYQAISLYATVSPIICLLIMHKKYESKGAGKTAIWLMAAANGILLISETQLLGALLYPGSIYHFADFLRIAFFWIPVAIHGLLLGLITVLALRKTEDQKLYIRKMSLGFRIHAICSYSAIYAILIHMADLWGDSLGWFKLTMEIILLFIFISVLTSAAIFISNIPYIIFCKYPKKQ